MRFASLLAPLLVCGCAVMVPPDAPLPIVTIPGLAPAATSPKASPGPAATPGRVGHVVLITSTPAPSPTPTPKARTPFDMYPSKYPWPLPSNMCDEAFGQFDVDHNGYLSEEEYQRVGLSKVLYGSDARQDRGVSRQRYGYRWCGSGRDGE